ncbi:hypothetical protein MKK55_08810 [Methylobacterium sp. J-059]|uniref:hypothetical protein n=1 Tax=Methylobacterium sp. J-059 TaxID=2836643 RepID=UPI001FBAECDD|nr:hypothetical protein [Methylobacterium sp. J-059]MCJ2039050.1 hypothetical protein [Methylobacterium sp. J-059]
MNDLLQQRWEWDAVLIQQEGGAEQRSNVLIGDRPVHDLRVQHLIGEEAGETRHLG